MQESSASAQSAGLGEKNLGTERLNKATVACNFINCKQHISGHSTISNGVYRVLISKLL